MFIMIHVLRRAASSLRLSDVGHHSGPQGKFGSRWLATPAPADAAFFDAPISIPHETDETYPSKRWVSPDFGDQFEIAVFRRPTDR